MFACQACMKRCLHTLVGDAAVLSSSRLLQPPAATFHSSRRYQQDYSALAERKSDAPTGTPSTSSKRRQQWLDSRGVRPAHKPAKQPLYEDFVVRKHLQYLKDPLKLAEHVRKCLRENEIDASLAIVRAASKTIKCTVSWNHLIDWQLSNGKINGAIRIYNEMKKRAQHPDARTYTIIFNGCANLPSAMGSHEKILPIYYSMLTDRSPIKPNTIHMNAILKMCARAQNMDALYTIMDKLPTKGLRAANNLTYTTILNAFRAYAVNDLRIPLTSELRGDNRRKVLLDARRLWQGVTKRWLQGELWIDEELACAMGRILLLGGGQDHDDIMSLCEQTMNIPRQVPRAQLRSKKLIESRGEEITADGEDGEHESAPTGIETETAKYDPDAAAIDQFETTIVTKSPRTSATVYCKPGRNTLSVLMQSFLGMRQRVPATRYWELLTQEYGVVPDAENYHAYLRVLRVARASTEVVIVLSKMPQPYMENKTFRIAIAACGRDKNNRHSFENAGRIIDIMQDTKRTPDVRTLDTYLDVAINSPTGTKASSNGEYMRSKLVLGQQIIKAITRIVPSYVNIRALLEHSNTRRTEYVGSDNLVKDAIALTRKLISAHDQLIKQNLVPREQHAKLARQRSKLTAFVTKYNLEPDPEPSPSIPFDTNYQTMLIPDEDLDAQVQRMQEASQAS